jgi:hypothetical protein
MEGWMEEGREPTLIPEDPLRRALPEVEDLIEKKGKIKTCICIERRNAAKAGLRLVKEGAC